jgi:hypothetical protein
MIERVRTFDVAILPKDIDCSALTEQNADLFYTAAYYSEPLLKDVVSEFEDALEKEAGLVGKVLRETKTVEIKKGGITLTVTATPSSKTSYMEVGKAIDQYLTDLETANESGLRRDGVRRIDDRACISIDEVLARMDCLIKENTTPVTNVKIDYTKPREDPAKTVRLLAVEPGTYGKVTENNAEIYRLAKEQLKLLAGKVTKPFNTALKAETGFSAEHLPTEMTVDSFGVGRYIFMVTSIPKRDVKYGEAAKAFIAHVKQCQENSEGVRERDGVEYLVINELVNEYRALVAENTKPIMEQRVGLLPNPKYDRVLVSF